MIRISCIAFATFFGASCTSQSAQKNKLIDKDSAATCAMSGVPGRFTTTKTISDSSIRTTGTDASHMIFIDGGTFKMGATGFADAVPVHEVRVNSFYMDEHEVTNAQFEKFVKATGYITVAEKPLDPKEFPNVDPAMLVPGSAVFVGSKTATDLSNELQWWDYIPGANWRQPEGPGSSITNRQDHPVTQLAYQDAEAYARWAGKRLPTEAEWEYAAKSGKHTNETYYWGNEKKESGKWLANIYQGQFPAANSKEDGFESTAPVKSYPANAYGLYDMEGNVWEWCSDFYRPDYYASSEKNNPKGPQDSYDPQEPGLIKRVQRGGSFLCNDQYCERYKAGARGKGEINSPTNNVGFRCVKDI